MIRKSAPCAVRTDRRNGGHAIGHRRAAASCREQLLQGGAPQTSIFSLQMHRPSPPQGACARHSRVARNGTSYIACRATTWQASHVENSTIQIDHVEGYTDLEWPIDARNRRNVLCACFSHAQTRPEITPYPKSAHNGTPNSERNSGCATDRSPIKMHHIERCTGPEWRAHAPVRRNAPHACFGHAKSVPRALCSHIWCSQWHLS